MQQDSNHIDELLRERLHDATAAPPDFVWPRVEDELRKRRRRFLFFWLFGAGMVATASLGWWWHSAGAQSTVSGNSAVVMDRTTEKSASTPEESALISATETPEKSKTARNAVNNNTAEHTPETGTSASPTSGKQIKTTTKSPQIATGKPAVLPEMMPVPAVSESTVENVEKRTSETDPLPETLPHVPVSGPTTQGASPVGTDYTAPMSVTARIMQMTPLHLHAQTRSRTHPRVFASSLKSHGDLFPPPVPIIRKNKKETSNCYDFAQHPNVLLLDAYLGPSLTRKEMRTGPDNQPYLADRRKTERRDWSFNAGVRASLLLDRHFLFRTGLHYDQINEVFEYIDPNSVEVIIRQTTQIINGQPVTVIDTLGVEYGENYLKTYNRFGMLDIPLELGVELRNGRTGLSLNGGIALNVLFWKRGAILSPIDGRPAYFTPDNGTVDVFRTHAGLSAIGSIQWFCHLRPRLRVFAEPYGRMVLRPVNIPNHPVEQRYGILGLKVGMTRILD